MPVVREFPATLSIAQLVTIASSLGAHVAAKLGHFGTDERTLTDDMCDMFYTWARSGETSAAVISFPEALRVPLNILVRKTTQQEEAELGADLAIRIESPLGVKRALLQAKVFDPQNGRLRCDPDGWDKLWSQLYLMRNRSRLAFLLIYVPADLLDQARQGQGTWEQGFPFPSRTETSSRFGATLIPVRDLLTPTGDWRYDPPVDYLPEGRFTPPGISLTRLILEMILCRRGKWRPSREVDKPKTLGFPIHYTPYREIGLRFADISENDWRHS